MCNKNLKMFSKLSTNHGMKIIIHGRSEIKFYIYGHFRAQKSRKWKWYDTMDLIEYKVDRFFFIVFVLFGRQHTIYLLTYKIICSQNEPILKDFICHQSFVDFFYILFQFNKRKSEWSKNRRK